MARAARPAARHPKLRPTDAPRQSKAHNQLARVNQHDHHPRAATPDSHPDRRQPLIQIVALQNTHPDSRFIGFDSFTGLPERWRGRKAGYFDCGGRTPRIGDERVSFVTGWFNRTLPTALDGLLPMAPDHQILVHLDADLYSAALYVLSTLSVRLGDFPVMFDEFGAGEGRALKDLLAAYGGSFTPLLGMKRARYSLLPTRVFGHLRLGGVR